MLPSFVQQTKVATPYFSFSAFLSAYIFPLMIIPEIKIQQKQFKCYSSFSCFIILHLIISPILLHLDSCICSFYMCYLPHFHIKLLPWYNSYFVAIMQSYKKFTLMYLLRKLWCCLYKLPRKC